MHPLSSPSLFCLLCYTILCLVPVCNSVLRRLAVYNIAEWVVCWYIITVCINGYSYMGSSSFNSSFPPSFLGHVGDLCLPFGDAFRGWLSVFLFLFPVFIVLLGTSTSKLYLSTGTANEPIASILFFALYSVSKTNLNLLTYSFFNLSFSFLSSLLWLSSILKYLNTFLRSSS